MIHVRQHYNLYFCPHSESFCQVPHLIVLSMEAKGNVCIVHVGCTATSGSQQNGFCVCLYSRVLP
jgi:hypothetical protein